MKVTIFLVILSVAAMAVMISQAVRQEYILYNLKVMARDKTVEVMKKEQSIAVLKKSLQELKPQLNSVQTMTETFKKKKDELQKQTSELEASLNTCNNEKAEIEKKKSGVAETLKALKTQHEGAKQTAQKEIQDLKQKNLDREKAICALIDTTNAEARKLCGLPEAPK